MSANGGIYKNSKTKIISKYGMRAASGAYQNLIANDVKDKQNRENLKYSGTQEDFDSGIKWFDSGLPLEQAPEEMKKNVRFINGFNKGQRIKLVNDTLYDLGRDYFERGITLEDTPDNYKNNEYFVAGYNNARSIKKK